MEWSSARHVVWFKNLGWALNLQWAVGYSGDNQVCTQTSFLGGGYMCGMANLGNRWSMWMCVNTLALPKKLKHEKKFKKCQKLLNFPLVMALAMITQLVAWLHRDTNVMNPYTSIYSSEFFGVIFLVKARYFCHAARWVFKKGNFETNCYRQVRPLPEASCRFVHIFFPHLYIKDSNTLKTVQ